MSAVLTKEKQHYRQALWIETWILLGLAGIVLCFSGLHIGLSFLSGVLAAFLPQCLFIYWIFFRQTVKPADKLRAFYRGEGLKWSATVGLIVLAFTGLPVLSPLGFFFGYFLGLLSNIAIPMVLKHRKR